MIQEKSGRDAFPSGVAMSATVAEPPFAGVKVWIVREVVAPEAIPGLARRELAEWMGRGHEALADLQLIASELVTNALVHAAAEWVRMHLVPEPGFWRLLVIDPGRNGRVPHPRVSSETDEHGRGLRVVHDVTGGLWGTYQTVVGERTVWALVPRLGDQSSQGRRP